MNEIERAIGEIDTATKSDRCISLSDGTRISKEWVHVTTLETALTVLRAELARQDVTCDGCKDQEDMYVGDTMCYDCRRFTTLPDRYEPKGEKA